MLRKRIVWAALVIVLALAGGGYAYYSQVYLPAQVPEETLMTAQVTRGDLLISVSGSGAVSPASQRLLGFGTAGYVDEVLVQVGDRVQEGDVLARLETDDLELSAAKAEVYLRKARLNLVEASETATEAQLTDARGALRDAQNNLAIAQLNYDSVQNSSLVAAVRARQIEFQWAVDRYWELEESGASQSRLEDAWDDRAIAEYRFNRAVEEWEMEQLEVANRLDQARNRVVQAEESLELMQERPAADAVKRAELNVERAELALEKAREDLEAAVLRAPFSGTVVDVAAIPGQRVGTEGILNLVSLARPQMVFWVQESDVAGVAVGNRAQIEFEGLPDDLFTGTVTRVHPALVSVDGALAVQAWASIDVLSEEVPLLGDMNADVEVISAEARDVVLAPIQALREIGDAQYAVFVVGVDGELAMRPVEIGLKDLVNAEIVSGLEAGEVVSLGAQPSASTEPSEGEGPAVPGLPGGIPGGGMFGGGGGKR